MRRVALAIVSTIASLVVLLSFKTHSNLATPAAAVSPATAGGSSDSGGANTTGTATSAPAKKATAKNATGNSAPKSSTASAAAKTVTGDAVETQYGPVQVQITVKNGTITAATAVEYPSNDPRDQQINAYAIPQLNQEAVAAQSDRIDMVSGATYTSEGYLSSLQSALDKAGL